MIDNPTLQTRIDFAQEVNPAAVGMSPEGVEAVLATLHSQLERGLQIGAQLVVLRHGRVVVDRALGLARRRAWPFPPMPVRADTPFLVFSTTKPFTAVCVHHLAEQGRLDLDAPVSRYWPEFGCRGKETATVRHTLAHQAGIPMGGFFRLAPRWPSWRWITRGVAGLKAEFPPGTQTAYHAVNGGFVLGEVVRRVSGLPIQEYLRVHFLEPLGLGDTSLGLSADQRKRAAGVYAAHPSQALPAWGFGAPPMRRAVIPAASLHTSARDLAIFFQMLVNRGVYNGQRYLQAETVRQATQLHYDGLDRTTKRPMRWALGFHLGGMPVKRPKFHFFGAQGSAQTFGHAGQGSCIAWGDFEHELVFAFTCNTLLHPLEAGLRWQALAEAVWGALGK
jgi:CubicO group peptidase (beta-lactamase class C family)